MERWSVTARGKELEQGGRAAGGARGQQVVAPRLPLTRGQRQVYSRALRRKQMPLYHLLTSPQLISEDPGCYSLLDNCLSILTRRSGDGEWRRTMTCTISVQIDFERCRRPLEPALDSTHCCVSSGLDDPDWFTLSVGWSPDETFISLRRRGTGATFVFASSSNLSSCPGL
jgi:hypothetical protein